MSLGDYRYRCDAMLDPGLAPGMWPGPPGHTGIGPTYCDNVFTDTETRADDDSLTLLD